MQHTLQRTSSFVLASICSPLRTPNISLRPTVPATCGTQTSIAQHVPLLTAGTAHWFLTASSIMISSCIATTGPCTQPSIIHKLLMMHSQNTLPVSENSRHRQLCWPQADAPYLIAGQQYKILGVRCPCLEHIKRGPTVQHARGGKEHTCPLHNTTAAVVRNAC